MKHFVVVIGLFLISFESLAKYTFGGSAPVCKYVFSGPQSFGVFFQGQSVVISGDVKETADSFTIRKVRVKVSHNSPKYFLDVDPGYGSQPLDELCYLLTQGRFPYADSYGNVDTMPLFSAGQKFVVEQELGLATGFRIEPYDSGIHYMNLQCVSRPRDY